MIEAGQISKGLIIEFNNDFYTVIDFQHVKPGKGGAFVRTKLKSLTTGNVLENTFNAGASVTTARIDKKPYQFLYSCGDVYVFMNNEDFEQIEINKERIPNYKLLSEGQDIFVITNNADGRILGIELPLSMEVEIVEVEGTVKGNTVTQVMKKARTKNGAEILVPAFIEEGDTIKINTANCEYKERVNKNKGK